MASPDVQPPKPDLGLAQKTLDFLGSRLRKAQYTLHKTVAARRVAQADEARARGAIAALTSRIQREIDAHPGLYRQETRREEGEG